MKKLLNSAMDLIPTQNMCDEFNLIYEIHGAQKALDFLCHHYGIAEMNIVIDGMMLLRGADATYYPEQHVAYFKRESLDRFIILHEFYHH